MNNILSVAVIKTFHYLLENVFCDVLGEASSPSNIVEEITTRTKFNNENNMFLCLKRVVEADDVVMPYLLQYEHFLHNLLLRALIFTQVMLIDTFDGNKLLR